MEITPPYSLPPLSIVYFHIYWDYLVHFFSFKNSFPKNFLNVVRETNWQYHFIQHNWWSWQRRSVLSRFMPSESWSICDWNLKKDNQKEDLVKHCQRHNGPEGWVHLAKVTSCSHITSSNTNLDHISSSESRLSINKKSQPNISISTKLKIQNLDQT